MQLKLHTIKPPSGRCLILTKCISLVSSCPGQWCIDCGQRLFDGQHPIDKPLHLPVAEETHVANLKSICEEYGIIVREETNF